MLLIYWVWNTYSLCLWGTTVHLYWGLVICWGLVNCTFPTLGTSAEWRELFSWERIDSVCVFVRDQTMANYSLTLSPSRMCWQLILTLLLWFFQYRNSPFFLQICLSSGVRAGDYGRDQQMWSPTSNWSHDDKDIHIHEKVLSRF